jgi:hypothetical protein
MDPRTMRRYITGDAQLPSGVELALQYFIFERKSKVKES